MFVRGILFDPPRRNSPPDGGLFRRLAGGLGFEPRLTESESVVLPLDDLPIVGTSYKK